MRPEKLCIYAVGDVKPDYPNPESLFEPALPTLKKADIIFGHLECLLSRKGKPQLHMYPHVPRIVGPEKVSALTYAGFHVMSFASNAVLDRGEQALFETLDTLNKNNIAVIGAGRDIEEARKPFIIERKGTRVGFLAYCSVLPKGSQAGPNKSGAAPARATTAYEQVDSQPGTPPRIITLAHKDDLTAMVNDIKKLRSQVDVLIVSMHWGVHFVPAVIAMYQKELGYAAIDAGADLILGHHAHILKGIEVYKGRVIFYGLGNFVMPQAKTHFSPLRALYPIKEDPAYPHYYFPIDSRKTIIANCTIWGRKIGRVSFLPVMITNPVTPVVPRRNDKGFFDVADYVKDITESQGLSTRFEIDDDEVVVDIP